MRLVSTMAPVLLTPVCCMRQVEMEEGQKLALLAAEFPELSRGECQNALEAQAGNLQAAAAILALHASSVGKP